MNKLIQFFKDEGGASSVEYGIMAAAVAAVIVIGAFSVGRKVSILFDRGDDAIP
jgi:pilus assembly protein Flp/PilA